MRYLFSKGEMLPDGSFKINADSVKRWTRQMSTPYDELPENERRSDVVEAQEYLKFLVDMENDGGK